MKAPSTASWVMHGDVLLAVALGDQADDALLRAVEVGVGADLEQQAEERAAVEHLHGGGHRHDGHVVHVDAQLQAPGREDADHAHPPVAHADDLADRVPAGEELRRRLLAEHGDRGAAVPLQRGQEAAAGDRPAGAPRASRASLRPAPPGAAARRRPPSRCP